MLVHGVLLVILVYDFPTLQCVFLTAPKPMTTQKVHQAVKGLNKLS